MIKKLSYKLENMPLFVSDGLHYYKSALLKTYGVQKKYDNPYDGRHKSPLKTVPPEGLRYGKLKKTVKDGRLLKAEQISVFGKVEKSEITTSVVERLNLTFRQEMNRFSRKTIGGSKKRCDMYYHFGFYVRYYNFCRPHFSHKIKGIRYGTPAMVAGVTDDIWSIRKLLFFPFRNYIN